MTEFQLCLSAVPISWLDDLYAHTSTSIKNINVIWSTLLLYYNNYYIIITIQSQGTVVLEMNKTIAGVVILIRNKI